MREGREGVTNMNGGGWNETAEAEDLVIVMALNNEKFRIVDITIAVEWSEVVSKQQKCP